MTYEEIVFYMTFYYEFAKILCYIEYLIIFSFLFLISYKSLDIFLGILYSESFINVKENKLFWFYTFFSFNVLIEFYKIVLL